MIAASARILRAQLLKHCHPLDCASQHDTGLWEVSVHFLARLLPDPESMICKQDVHLLKGGLSQCMHAACSSHTSILTKTLTCTCSRTSAALAQTQPHHLPALHLSSLSCGLSAHSHTQSCIHTHMHTQSYIHTRTCTLTYTVISTHTHLHTQ